MRWSQEEIEKLFPIIERMQLDLEPLDGKNILVLCSASGDVAFWFAERIKYGQIIGLELSEELLKIAQSRVKEKELESIVEFRKAEKTLIPVEDERFDVLVSEFIIYPTHLPTEIGQREMARVLKPSGKMILTDVIATRNIPRELREELRAIGLDYICKATQDNFRNWMKQAGLTDIEVIDFTPVVRRVWEHRRNNDTSERHKGYSILLDDEKFRLGKSIFYIYVKGVKRR